MPDARRLLSVEHLTTGFDIKGRFVPAVIDVSFGLSAGETLCLVGESGSGKSVTALSILRLVQPPGRIAEGRIVFDGTDLRTLGERDMQKVRGAEIALIFQEPMTALNPVFTIGNQIEETLLVHGRATRRSARAKAIELLDAVSIPEPAKRVRDYPHQLSGGLRQRALIAMSLACEPRVVIADEPTTALDVTIQAQILHLLASIRRELDMAMILITHDLGIVARVATHAAVMYAGEIVETGSAREVFAQPTHPYTQGLLRCIPVPGKVKRRARLGSIPGLVPSLIGDVEGCVFRNRCPHAFEDCAVAPVALAELSPGRAYRCLLPPAQCAANALAAAS
jgi:peptide/nickel transport system ATP-binding protein